MSCFVSCFVFNCWNLAGWTIKGEEVEEEVEVAELDWFKRFRPTFDASFSSALNGVCSENSTESDDRCLVFLMDKFRDSALSRCTHHWTLTRTTSRISNSGYFVAHLATFSKGRLSFPETALGILQLERLN